jgi:hypothetical protein
MGNNIYGQGLVCLDIVCRLGVEHLAISILAGRGQRPNARHSKP